MVFCPATTGLHEQVVAGREAYNFNNVFRSPIQGNAMGTEFEKEFDDEVYEDEFYDDEAGAELVDEEADDTDETDDKGEKGDDWDKEEKRVDVSFACEECDYRWDDVIFKSDDEYEAEEIDIVCPMCGTTNVTLI